MTDRKNKIFAAIDKMIEAHDQWVEAEDTTEEPPEILGLSIEAAQMTIEEDAVPSECLEIHGAMLKLSHEWRRYHTEGHYRAVRTNEGDTLLIPHASLWSAFKDVLILRSEKPIEEQPKIESVKSLRKQGLTDLQIARCYGDSTYDARNNVVWVGPFFTDGNPDSDLIDKEEKKPGSVIKSDWVPPWAIEKQKSRKLEVERRMKQIKDREDRDDSIDRPPVEDVEAMGREGCSVEQIERVCRVSADSVVKRLEDAGIPVRYHADIMNARAPHDRAQPGDDYNPADDEPAEKTPADKKLNEKVYRLFDEGSKAGEIGKTLGIPASEVVKILKGRETETANEGK